MHCTRSSSQASTRTAWRLDHNQENRRESLKSILLLCTLRWDVGYWECWTTLVPNDLLFETGREVETPLLAQSTPPKKTENPEFSHSSSDGLITCCWFIDANASLVFTHSESLSKCYLLQRYTGTWFCHLERLLGGPILQQARASTSWKLNPFLKPWTSVSSGLSEMSPHLQTYFYNP